MKDMGTINKVDTIELLKDFWAFLEHGKYPKSKDVFSEDQDDIIAKFVKDKYPEIKNPKQDIWNIVLINKF